MQAQAKGSMPSRPVRFVSACDLVAAALHDMADLEFTHARRDGRRTPPAHRGNGDAAVHQ